MLQALWNCFWNIGGFMNEPDEWIRRGAGWHPYIWEVCAGGCWESLKNEFDGLRFAETWAVGGGGTDDVCWVGTGAIDCETGKVYSESLVKSNWAGCEWKYCCGKLFECERNVWWGKNCALGEYIGWQTWTGTCTGVGTCTWTGTGTLTYSGTCTGTSTLTLTGTWT